MPVSTEVEIFDDGVLPVHDLSFAFVVFSLVPYLGILFSPFAIGMSLVALRKRPGSVFLSRRSRISLAVLSISVFGAQIVLWSILYLAPTVSGIIS